MLSDKIALDSVSGRLMCNLVLHATIGLPDDLSLATDQVSGHLLVISLKVETDIAVSVSVWVLVSVGA